MLGQREGLLSRDVPVYCPSPSAREITKVYRQHRHDGWFRPVVARAVERLLKSQLKEGDLAGLFGPARGHYNYGHALATVALGEAYSLDFGRLPRPRRRALRDALQAAMKYIVRAQTPQGAWGYDSQFGARERFRNDSSVSIFQVIALAALRRARIFVPERPFERFSAWLRKVTDGDGVVGYERPGDRRERPSTLTAGALYVEELLGLMSPTRERQARDLRRRLEGPTSPAEHNGLLRFYAALAFSVREQGILDLLVPGLLTDQRKDGSWDASGDTYARLAGDAFLTAINVLSITCAYQH